MMVLNETPTPITNWDDDLREWKYYFLLHQNHKTHVEKLERFKPHFCHLERGHKSLMAKMALILPITLHAIKYSSVACINGKVPV